MAELNPDNMYEILPGTYKEDVIPKGDPYNFQEGSSPRKINGMYYLVFASGGTMTYATSKSPTGPFAFGGPICRNDGKYWPGGNNHGGIACLNDQWYVFYHRMTNNTVFSRRACVEPLAIAPDGSIKEVDQTSLGFQTSLDPYQITDADIACVLMGGSYITEVDKQTHPVINNKNGSIIGYKCFDFGQLTAGQGTTFSVDVRDGASSGKMEVWIDGVGGLGRQIGTVSIQKPERADQTWREITIPVSDVIGRHAVYFKFLGGSPDATIADLRSFAFKRSPAPPG